MDPLIKDWLSFGGMGVCAGVLFFFSNKLIGVMSRLISVFQEEMAQEREKCQEQHALMTEHLVQLTDQVRLMQEKLVVLVDRNQRRL